MIMRVRFYKRLSKYLILLLIFAVTLIRCSSSDERTPSATATVQPNPAASMPSPTPTSTYRHTQTPTATLSPTATPTPQPSATPTITPNPTPASTKLTIRFEKMCIYATGDLPFSRADIYFSLRLIDPTGMGHTIGEVPQPKLIKKAASVNCADPLLFGDQQSLKIQKIEGTCLRVEGEFWNANRLTDDILVGKIDEPICYQQKKWAPIGQISRHLTGGGADWEVFLWVE